tara:strand:+ start:378 stop:872 length:495 start_codon:yes stop_codon:yes gene_type:complete
MNEGKNPKALKNGGDGTNVGNALRWLAKQGKDFAPELLNIVGTVTGVEGLKDLGDAIRKDDKLSDLDKELLLQELELDMVREEEISKRWKYDLNSDSWMSKNIRPLTLAFLLICMFIFVMLDSFLEGFKMNVEWIFLLKSLLITAVGGYFVVRSGEKVMKTFKK